MMKRTILVLTGLALVLAPLTSLADDDPLVGDRPDFTESPATIAVDRLQLEAGYTRAHFSGVDVQSIGELLMRIGVAANTEIRVHAGGWLRFDDDGPVVDGLADPGLGVKQRLLAGEGSVPELALLAVSTIPIGNSEVSLKRPVPSLIAAAGWSLDERVGLGANLGWAQGFDVGADERFASFWLSASLAYALTDRWGVFLEGYGFDREEKDGDTNAYVDAGVTWLLDPDFQLDARCGRGFNGLDYDWFAGLGLVARF